MISLPELNELLVAHNCLHAISIQLNEDGMAYDLSLSISAFEKVGADVVRIRFIDISQFTSRDFGGGLTQLMHMNVNKLDSGFDRMRYQLSDLEDGKIIVLFFIVLGFLSGAKGSVSINSIPRNVHPP